MEGKSEATWMMEKHLEYSSHICLLQFSIAEQTFKGIHTWASPADDADFLLCKNTESEVLQRQG